MTPLDYEFLRKFLKERSGLMLSADKQYLVESRLTPVARRVGLNGIADICAKLKLPGNEALASMVTEAMTTNESFFFRDKTPFDLFKDTMLPALTAARGSQKRLRIWCAAASTGQEPYSLAMILKEMSAQLAGWRFEIIATDLSNEVLEKAKAGIYSQFEVQRGLPIDLLLKYFQQHGDMWQLSSDIRSMVQYKQFNLLKDFGLLGQFDVVFCRNVLIYFDQPTKTDVLERLARVTAQDGYLLLGAAETVVGLTNAFKTVPDKRGLYMRNSEAGGAAAMPRFAIGSAAN